MNDISPERHGELLAAWPGKVYQDRAANTRLCQFAKRVTPFVAGAEVLEIGSNAGLLAAMLCGDAASYVGLEPDPHFAAQADITASKLGAHFTTARVPLARWKPGTTTPTAILATRSLYHLQHAEVRKLSVLLSGCDVVGVQTKGTRARVRTNRHCLWDSLRLLQFLEKRGFVCHCWIDGADCNTLGLRRPIFEGPVDLEAGTIGDDDVSYGAVGFYSRLAPRCGVKVWYSLLDGKRCSLGRVTKAFRSYQIAHEIGLAPEPYFICECSIGGEPVYGIVVQHITPATEDPPRAVRREFRVKLRDVGLRLRGRGKAADFGCENGRWYFLDLN